MISPFYPSNDPKAFISIWVVRGVGVSAFNKALHSEPQVEDMNPELVRLNQSEMPPLVPFWSGNRVKQSEQSSGPQVASQQEYNQTTTRTVTFTVAFLIILSLQIGICHHG